MKLETTTAALRLALDACSKVTPKRANRPILESVRIVTDGESRIEGTDLECYVRATLAASTVDTGAAIVSLVDLLAFVKTAEGERITLEGPNPDGLFRVDTEAGESITLATADLDEWPTFPESGDDLSATMDAVELSRALVRATPAMAKDPGRYSMHGAQVEIPERGAVRLIATDGRRLHVVDVLGEVETYDHDSCPGLGILPSTGCKALLAFLPKKYKRGQGSSVAALAYSPVLSLFFFVLDGVELIVRALDGEFPRWAAVLPADNLGSALVDSAELIKRTKLVSAACSDDAAAVALGRDGDAMTVSAKSVGKESSAELRTASVAAWPVVKGEGDARFDSGPLGLNPDYLLDTVKAAQVERVEIRWNNPQSPIEFRAEGFRGIVMPITLDR